MSTPRRLVRSHDRIVSGVCGGIADFLGWEPRQVRALYVFVSLVSAAFPGIVAYAILTWVMPPADNREFRLEDFRKV